MDQRLAVEAQTPPQMVERLHLAEAERILVLARH
jgi:hypothetical protein